MELLFDGLREEILWKCSHKFFAWKTTFHDPLMTGYIAIQFKHFVRASHKVENGKIQCCFTLLLLLLVSQNKQPNSCYTIPFAWLKIAEFDGSVFLLTEKAQNTVFLSLTKTIIFPILKLPQVQSGQDAENMNKNAFIFKQHTE